MSDDPVGIINEYLTLVREKLPEAIADDVITELETYMLETARDLGDDGQITVESAKKVVAQFGAPGEVADEYRFSMLPETIPEDDIPTEILHDTQDVETDLAIDRPKETAIITRKRGKNPTVTHSTFFIKSVILTTMWAAVVVALTSFLGPFWDESWTRTIFLAPTLMVILAIPFLLLYSYDLKKSDVILWSRSYPDWSSLQVLVTLPENSIPESIAQYKIFDIILSFCGIVLFTPYILQGYNAAFILLIGIPTVVLLAIRILINGKKMDDESDHIQMAKYAFGANLSLLVILNASFWWTFSVELGSTYLQSSLMPAHSMYVILFGTALLLQVVTGAQNLWWKTQDESSTKPISRQTVEVAEKEKLIEILPDTVGRLFAKTILWIIVFNAVPIYLSAAYIPSYSNIEFTYRLVLFLVGIILTSVLLFLYLTFRYVMIRRFNFVRIIGQRTRVEALIDAIASSVLLLPMMTTFFIVQNYSFEYTIVHYQELLGSLQLGYLLGIMEIIPFVLISIGLVFRLFGDGMEFATSWKRGANRWIEQSGILLIVTLTIMSGVEYFKHNIMTQWYGYSLYYPLYWLFVAFFAFQVETSSLKLKLMKKGNHDTKTPESKDVSHNIANNN